MCVIIYKPQEGELTQDDFENAVDTNSDGIGIMYVEEGRVHVYKAVGKLEDQQPLYDMFIDKPTACMHLRLKTHGLITEDNCHPYKVLSIDDDDPIDLYMMHNGVISSYREVDKDMSDTWNFIEATLKPLLKIDHTLIYNTEFQDLIEGYIGSSKLVFLDDTENIIIINEDAGSQRKGCWVSNTHSFTAKTTYYNNYSYQNNFGKKKTNQSTTKNSGTGGTTTKSSSAIQKACNVVIKPKTDILPAPAVMYDEDYEQDLKDFNMMENLISKSRNEIVNSLFFMTYEEILDMCTIADPSDMADVIIDLTEMAVERETYVS